MGLGFISCFHIVFLFKDNNPLAEGNLEDDGRLGSERLPELLPTCIIQKNQSTRTLPRISQ